MIMLLTDKKSYQKVKNTAAVSFCVFVSLVSLLLIFLPENAEAVVPVQDQANLNANSRTATSVMSLTKKEFVLDNIAWTLAKSLSSSLIRNVTQWVRTGFEGNPLFITDLSRFALDAANEASGIFLEEYLQKDTYNSLCQPWRNPIHLALTRANTGISNKNYKPQCTLADVINNASKMTDFMNDFQKGGWEAWGSLTASPANNPLGAYLDGLDAMDKASAEAKANAEKEAQMGQGFIGQKKCLSKTPEGRCKEWTIESPGTWVESQLAESTSAEIKNLELADELDELLGALAGQLNNWILEGLAKNPNEGNTPGPSTQPPASVSTGTKQNTINIIEQSVNDETEYVKTKQNTVETYSQSASLYASAKACLETQLGKISSCGGTSETSAGQVQANTDYVNKQITNINNNLIPGFNQEIAASNTLITKLRNLETSVQAVTTAQGLSDLYDQFSVFIQNAHNPYDQSKADQELEKAEQTKQDAQNQISNCQALPITCVAQETVTGP